MEMYNKKKEYDIPVFEIEWFTIIDALTSSGSYGDHGDDDEDPFGDGTNSVMDPTF